MLIGSFFRNFSVYYGYQMALEVRKLLVAAMYDKVAKMSMRSLTETNSGKLITLVSSDIFSLERPLTMAPFCLVSPFINIACYGLIWFISGWPYAVMLFGLWILTLTCQALVTSYQKRMKQAEAMCNDERMKLINDMVTGIRTIKAYAWENHYCEKVIQQRKK